MTHYEQALGNNGNEKLHFNRTKPLAKPGSGRDNYMDKRQAVESARD